MVRIRLISVMALVTVLGACAQVQKTVDKFTTKPPPPPPVQPAPPKIVKPVLPLVQVGTYRCELKRSVRVTGVSPADEYIDIQWASKNHRLAAVTSNSGARRYENKVSGLTWIGVVGKAMLLDAKRGKQLANECRR
ncbi:MAG: MliC family protein [Burkholderiaceae bacterium]